MSVDEQPRLSTRKDLQVYKGQLKTGMHYYVPHGKYFMRLYVRQRLTAGSRVCGITIYNEESEEEYRIYRETLAKMRELDMIYIEP